MGTGRTLLERISATQNAEQFRQEHWQGSFEEYLDIVREHPEVARSSHRRIYDMIVSYGSYPVDEGRRDGLLRYKFFDDPEHDGEDAIFGLTEPLAQLVNVFRSAALRYGAERRVLLLHGPVGSSKSTIARLLKRGLERYSRSPEGAQYTFGWKEDDGSITWDPMHCDPLQLIPPGYREEICRELNTGRDPDTQQFIEIVGDVCPLSRFYFRERLEKLNGDWTKVLESLVIKRFFLSEQDRIGIGTFQPKDEKNQDSTELTGDINYRKIAEFGSESDPRAFNFDGEFNIANRGMIEFIEVLKLDVAFLYDLLGASQEHKIKPKKFAQTDIDEVIIGHTNEPEYRKLQNNEFMEALRDRTVKIDVPYVTKLSHELKIYEKDYNPKRVRGKHIAPHTLEVAAMWAVLTRMEEPKHHGLTVLQKLKLYNGKTLPGFTLENVEQLRKEAKHEGLQGISPRYVQDKISNALVNNPEATCLNPFMVLNELEAGLRHHSLIPNEETRDAFRRLISVVKDEYTDVVKNEV
ncbi:MAG TPA: serine protein kinase, partial [Planctomycetaceae bacterium]|nr:serine protein kinase [Planctomycetaceae bacterium]